MVEDQRNKKRPAVEDVALPGDDEAFPRGGGDKFLTPLQKRQLTQQANADFQTEQTTGSKQKPKKAKLGKVGRRAAAAVAGCCCAAFLSRVQPPPGPPVHSAAR